MKIFSAFIIFAFQIIYSNDSAGQSLSKSDSINFFGNHYSAPTDCQTFGNMIKCTDYVFSWIYEPIKDLPRHKRELLAQTKNPKKITVTILGFDHIGYLTKTESFNQLLIVDSIKGQCGIINLWQNEPIIKTTNLPVFVRQLITLK